MTIEVSTTEKRDGRALALFVRWQDWQRGKMKDGRSFFAIPGGEPGLFHMADPRECSCPDFQHARNVCKHVRAVRLWMAAYQTGAVAPKPRPATPNVVDDSGTGDDLVILTTEGAAYLADRRAPDVAIVATTYASLYPTCRVKGCPDEPEPRSQDCYRHQLVDAF